MKIQQWPIAKPIPYSRNARKISEAAIAKVASSIKEYGWQQPVVVDGEGVVIVGHTRLLAAKKLGLDTVPVLVAGHLTAAQVKAYRLMDNRSHDETAWDFDLLGEELLDLKGLDFDLGLTGFDGIELAKFLVGDGGVSGSGAPESRYREQYGVIVVCTDEGQQQKVYERLIAEGLTCRVVVT